MDLGLKGKVAVITAASAGIGKGIATILAKEGCEVAICSRSSTKLIDTAEQIRKQSEFTVFEEVADVTNAISLDTFFNNVVTEFGKIDILVNNAGGPPPGKCFDFSDEQYKNAFDLTLMSVVRSCRKVVPLMVQQKWGRIINIESTSVKCALENMVLSNVFRSGVAAFSKTLAMEYAKDGIRSHCLLSGPFYTDRIVELGTKSSGQKGISFEQWRKEEEKRTPLGRFGDPLEFGALVAFLVSNTTDYMNGTCIPIDGGLLKTIS